MRSIEPMRSIEFSDLPPYLASHLVESGDCWVTANGSRAEHVKVSPPNGRRQDLRAAFWRFKTRKYRRRLHLEHSCGDARCVRHMIRIETQKQPKPRPGYGKLEVGSPWEARVFLLSFLKRGFGLWDESSGSDLARGMVRVNQGVIEWQE